MKRKPKWTGVVLAVLPLAFSTALFLWRPDRITVEKAQGRKTDTPRPCSILPACVQYGRIKQNRRLTPLVQHNVFILDGRSG
jgi:hypothetical protein